MQADHSKDRPDQSSASSSPLWQRWQLRFGQAARWCCGSPQWPAGAESLELRRRYAEIEASYEGIVTLQPHHRGIEDYFVKGQVLGEGGFGTVWQATPSKIAVKAQPALVQGKGYALKRVKLPMRDQEIEMISKSLLSVTTGRMLHFLKAIGSVEASEHHVTRNLLRILEIPHTMHIAMDLLEGPTLRDWMLENKQLSEQNCAELTRQMLRAVHFLHRTAGALHRDVKPQNFGFATRVKDQLPSLQLFDMGLVYVLEEPIVEASARVLWSLGLGGTMHWISPETWDGQSGACSDLWGVGLICHCLLLRQLPFGLQHCEERQAVWAAVKSLTPWSAAGASREASRFLESLLEKDPQRRATSSEALASPWLAAPSKLRVSVASAAQQRRVQLPQEVEGWKERSFWQSLMLQTSQWSKPN